MVGVFRILVLACTGCSSFEFQVRVAPVVEDVRVTAGGDLEEPHLEDGEPVVTVSRSFDSYDDGVDFEGIEVIVNWRGVDEFVQTIKPGFCASSGGGWDSETVYVSLLVNGPEVKLSGYTCEGGGREVTGVF